MEAVRSEISSVANQAYECVKEYAPTKERIVKNSMAVALPAIALVGICYIPGAEAGPITYASCMAGCLLFSVGFYPICIAACPALLIPALP